MEIKKLSLNQHTASPVWLHSGFAQSVNNRVYSLGFSMRSYLVDFAEQDSIDMIQTNLMTPIILTKLADIIKDSKTSNNDKFGHIVMIASAAARLYPPTRRLMQQQKLR